MHIQEKQRLIKTGRLDWLFSDSEPEWQTASLQFVAASKRFDIPKQITSRIAYPGELTMRLERQTDSETVFIIERPNLATGYHLARFCFKNDNLHQVTAEAVDENRTTQFYP